MASNGPTEIAGKVVLENATVVFAEPVILDSTAVFEGTQSSISFNGGVHLPATDISIPAGITVNAPIITGDGGRLLLPATEVRISARLVDDTIELRFPRLGHSSYVLYVSTDLQNWSVAAPQTAQTIGDEVICEFSSVGGTSYFHVKVE